MGKLHKKVIRVLRRRFGDVRDALEEVQSTGRVTGVVIAGAFDGLDFDERQLRLSKALQDSLTPQEQADVGPIAVLTPAEADVKAM
jgi:hypothetical protein